MESFLSMVPDNSSCHNAQMYYSANWLVTEFAALSEIQKKRGEEDSSCYVRIILGYFWEVWTYSNASTSSVSLFRYCTPPLQEFRLL